MTGIREAVLLASLERYLGLVLNFGTLAAVSRILTPEEVGIAVIGWAMLSVPYALRDLGTMDFIIQKKQLAPTEIRTATTIGLLASCMLMAIVLGCAPSIGAIYGDARFSQFLGVMAFAVLTDAIANPLVGLMRRDLAMRRVVVVNLGLAIVTAAVTIGFALAGMSFMSVAWAGLIGNAAAAVLAVCLRPQLWVFRPCLAHWRDVVRSGTSFSVMAMLMRLYEAIPFLALGRFMQPSSMGYYSRALQTCQLPDKVILAGIVSIAFPALAAEAREGRRLKPAYLGAIELITVAQWPALLLLAMLAPRIVQVLFGNQWVDAVPLVQIMALASLLGAAASLTYPVLYAIGDLRNAMLSTVLSLPLSALVMVGAASFGTTALAASLFFTIPFNNAVALHFIRRHLDFAWRELWACTRKSCVVSLLSVAGPLGIVAVNGLHFEQPLPVQIAMLGLAMAGWLVGLRVTRHPLLAEIRLAAGTIRRRVGASQTGAFPVAAQAPQSMKTG